MGKVRIETRGQYWRQRDNKARCFVTIRMPARRGLLARGSPRRATLCTRWYLHEWVMYRTVPSAAMDAG